MQDHRYSFIIDATPHEIWAVLHAPRPRLAPGEVDVIEHGDVRIEILYAGDEHGEGLIRHCHFKVPKFLLSKGRAESWECITEVVPYESSKYEAVGKPLWSKAEGWHWLEDLGDGRTRVHFRETYHVFNPIFRALLEKVVHRSISKDNDNMIKAAIERGLAARRDRRSSEVSS